MREVQRMAYRVAGRLPSPLKRVIVRMREARFLVGILGVITDSRGRVLLFRHTYRPFAPWGLPSGLLKPNESPGEAIVREVREETGLAVEFVEIMEVRSASGPQRLDIWVRCRSVGGTVRPSPEVEEAAFFELDSLPPLIAEQERFLRDHRLRQQT